MFWVKHYINCCIYSFSLTGIFRVLQDKCKHIHNALQGQVHFTSFFHEKKNQCYMSHENNLSARYVVSMNASEGSLAGCVVWTLVMVSVVLFAGLRG